jgi:hypothetical protein
LINYEKERGREPLFFQCPAATLTRPHLLCWDVLHALRLERSHDAAPSRRKRLRAEIQWYGGEIPHFEEID